MSEARRARVLVIGHACVDTVTLVPRAPGPDEKVEAEKAWCGGGGPAANAAVALARLGHDVALACALGEDVLGRIVAEELREEGVQLLVPLRPGTTSLAQIQARDGARSVVWRRGSIEPLALDEPRATAWLDGVDLLYVDGHEVEAASALVSAAAARDVPVLADLGTLRPGVERWLEHLVWAVASPRFATALADDDQGIERQLEVLAERAPRAVGVGVTRGGEGGVARIGGETLAWRPRKVGVVDTTAAGDAFHAGLADAWLQGMDPTRSLEWAATLGASVCRGLGGRKMLAAHRHDLTRFEARWPHRPRS